jgi:glycosyltransferase involved in cell wall biosynthesis
MILTAKDKSPGCRVLITPFFDATLPGGGSLYSIDMARVWLQRGHRLHVLCCDYDRNLLDLESYLQSGQLRIYHIGRTSNMLLSHVFDRNTYQAAKQIIANIKPESIHIHNFHGLLGAVWAAVESPYKTIYVALDFGLLCLNWYLYDGSATPCTGPESVKCERCLRENSRMSPKLKLISLLPSFMLKLAGKDSAYLKQYRNLRPYFRQVDDHLKNMLSLLKEFDFVITISPKTAAVLLSHGVPEERILCSTQGLYSVPKIEENRTDQSVTLVYLGHSALPKGFHVLAKVAELLPDGLKLRVLSYGEELRRFLNHCPEPAKRYIKSSSLLIGGEVENELVNCDALVIPSLWHENTPYSMLRALATSRPVIASNHEGISHLIAHGVNGFLLPPGNIEAWKNTLEDVALHPMLLRNMRTNCSYYKTVDQHADEVEGVIRQ